MRTRSTAALAGLGALLAATAAFSADPHTPIPPGRGFPADEATLERYRATEAVESQRRHAWILWAALNEPTADGAPLWETWHTKQAVFDPSAAPEALAAPSRADWRFERPRQFEAAPAGPEAAGDSLFAFVLFNEPARKHIRTNGYHLDATLASLNAGWPAGTAPKDRDILPFPRDSVALKVAWRFIPRNTPTAIPVWDPASGVPASSPHDATTWGRAVVVDPTRVHVPAGETRPTPWLGHTIQARVVSTSAFYSVPITATMAQAMNRPQFEGSTAILVGFHVTTKEISDWVWATFWWHDEPENGPFAAGRIDAVRGIWRNYLMDVSFDMTKPREQDGKPNGVMNPYLEARFADGVVSNCMTCHQRATYPAQNFLPVTRGGMDPNDPYFAGRTQTDFLWSLAR